MISGWETQGRSERVQEIRRLQSVDLGREDERPLLLAYLKEGSGPVRQALAELVERAAGMPIQACLDRLGGERTHPLSWLAIEDLLSDSGGIWRMRAAGRLGEREGDARAAARLHRLLLCERDEAVARSAIVALGRIGDPGACDALHCLWRGAQVPDALRFAAAEVLGDLGDREALLWLEVLRSREADGSIASGQAAPLRVW